MYTIPDLSRHFHPVLAARELRQKPVRVLLGGRPYVLFRDQAGKAAALFDRCPHRFAPLSEGHVRPDGRLACPYHGWHFDGEGKGCNPHQPALAKCDAQSLQTVERYGYVWMAARETAPGDFPSMDWEGYELAGSFTTLFEAPLHVALANFSEDEHLPHVHTRLGWDERGASEVTFEAESYEDRSEVLYKGPQRPSPLIRFLLVKPGDTFHNQWVTRFDPLRHLYSFHWTDRETGDARPLRLRTMIFQLPETAETTRFHVFLFVSLKAPRLRFLMPVIKRAAVALGRHEINDDAALVKMVAGTPYEMKGMRLDKFDKPVIHNNKLLRTLYFGEAAGATDAQPQGQASAASKPAPGPRAVAS